MGGIAMEELGSRDRRVVRQIETLRDRTDVAGEREAATAALQRIAVRPAKGKQLVKRQRLTDAICRKLPAPAKGKKIHYDRDVAAFGMRITEANARSFVLRYRRRSDAIERTLTIGSFPDWNANAAREEAKRLKRLVDGGGDPLGEAREQRQAPTVHDLADRFEAEFLPKKRASTAADYTSMLRTHIRPQLGKRKVALVESADVDALHRHVTAHGGPYRANRVVAVLSKMFSLSEGWRWRIGNPCRGIERNDEAKRKRYLTDAELDRLLGALAKHADQDAADIFRLLLLTGCRRGEALAARWNDFDLKKGIWTKPGATTKTRTDHVVPLSKAALELLIKRESAATDSEYVFPGRRAGHRVDVKGDWRRVLKAARISKLRIHDLRHSYASILASAGVGLHTIGELLGHTQAQTTLRYAHLIDAHLREASEKVGALIKKAAP
jgi:integrase